MCGASWANDLANIGSSDFFFTCGFHVLVKRNGMKFKDKIMFPCFREAKCLKRQQGFTAGI